MGQSQRFEGICDHSSKAAPGLLFFSIPSKSKEAKDFLDVALLKGATGVVAPSDIVLEKRSVFSHITFFGVKDARLALTKMAAAMYKQTPAFMAAVTGTNGKTSISQFSTQLWNALGQKSAALGTLGVTGVDIKPLPEGSLLTTPEPMTLYPLIDKLAKSGVQNMALEASSHGLDQRRLDGLSFQAAVFSSFSPEHLDYHGDMHTYWLAKTRLFRQLVADEGTAILYTDLENPHELREICKRKNLNVWRYGTDEAADARITNIQDTEDGQRVSMLLLGEQKTFDLPVKGHFQALNALAAVLLVHASGFPIDQILEHIKNLSFVPGRLQFAGKTPNGARIYIDYAHTPDALRTVLKDLRAISTRQVGVVFGCGGQRDPFKRPLMGQVAHELADFCVITDDNPRFEDPQKIREEIQKEAPKAHMVAGRAVAIEQAIHMLKRGDVLLIAGKGHETYQLVRGQVVPLDDLRVVQKCLASISSVRKAGA